MDLWSSGSDVLYEHVPYNFREDVPHDRYVLCNQRKDVSPEILAVLGIPAEPDADSDVRTTRITGTPLCIHRSLASISHRILTICHSIKTPFGIVYTTYIMENIEKVFH